MTKLLYTDLMLDIETLGQGAGCVIISIAAVPFIKSGDIPDQYPKCFHKNVDIQSCLDLGLTIDPNTLHWWIQKYKLFTKLQEDTFEIKGTLESLASFIKAECTEDVRVWGKGPSFDNAILRDAYQRVRIQLPWRYSRERCVRTFLCGYEEQLKNQLIFEGVEHNPTDDALHQIRCMQKVQSLVFTLTEQDHV